MKNKIAFLFIALTLKLTSVSFAKSPDLIIDSLATNNNTISIINDDTNNYEAAEAYLLSIENDKDFNLDETNYFIQSIVSICENEKSELKFISKVCTTLARLHGKIADKLRMKGIQNGKSLFRYIKIAIQLDPENTTAIIYHAETVLGVYDQGSIGRKVAEKALGINLNSELSNAKQNLERSGLTAYPIYKKITEALFTIVR